MLMEVAHHVVGNLQMPICRGIAYAVWWWAGQLVWPQPHPDDGSIHPTAKWGIAWFELLVNFIVTTGWYPPLKISGSGSTSQFVSYMSPEGQNADAI